jgi:hypothetical protein
MKLAEFTGRNCPEKKPRQSFALPARFDFGLTGEKSQSQGTA